MLKLKLLPLVVISVFILLSCDEAVTPEDVVDYFPTNSNNIIKYSSNAISGSENDFITFEMKIDSFAFSRGTYLALLGKREIDTLWGAIMGLKDSGNVIYGLGDNPPEDLVPMFKHEYKEDEAVTEKITLLGKDYDSKKVVLQLSDSVKLNWWFVNGIGLVKEESSKGASIFNDDNWGDDYNSKTELIDFTK